MYLGVPACAELLVLFFTLKRSKISRRLALFSSLLLSTGAVFPTSTVPCQARENIILQSQTAKMDRLPPPKMLQGSVGENVMQEKAAHPNINLFGFAPDGESYPKKVTYVEPGSVAWRNGLQANDKILEAHSTPKLAGMIVQRGAKKYFCMFDLSQLVAKNAGDSKGGGKKGDPTENLANYSIVMMVDDSASMGTADCPDKKTRWQWCREHVKEMYTANNAMLEKNISIVTFDTNIRSFRNCSAARLTDVFENVTPSGETNMAPALEEGFTLVRSQLEHGKPAMIALISDGRPTDVDAVKKSIINETNRLNHPELLSIVFIEVGTPEKYLRELDTELVKQGAAKDIVSVVQFTTVNSQPLTVTLSAEVAKIDATLKSGATLAGKVSSDNEAKKAISSHVFTPGVDKPVTVVHEAVRPQPAVRQPPVKAHPTGTSAVPEPAVVKTTAADKPVEIDEKESVLKHAANKHY